MRAALPYLFVGLLTAMIISFLTIKFPNFGACIAPYYYVPHCALGAFIFDTKPPLIDTKLQEGKIVFDIKDVYQTFRQTEFYFNKSIISLTSFFGDVRTDSLWIPKEARILNATVDVSVSASGRCVGPGQCSYDWSEIFIGGQSVAYCWGPGGCSWSMAGKDIAQILRNAMQTCKENEFHFCVIPISFLGAAYGPRMAKLSNLEIIYEYASGLRNISFTFDEIRDFLYPRQITTFSDGSTIKTLQFGIPEHTKIEKYEKIVSQSDLDAGIKENVNVSNGIVRLFSALNLNYSPFGSFTSQPFDAGQVVLWKRINVTQSIPNGTNITIQYRLSNDTITWTNWSASLYSPMSKASFLIVGESRYIQWVANLSTTNTTRTPWLYNVTFEYEIITVIPAILPDPNIPQIVSIFVPKSALVYSAALSTDGIPVGIDIGADGDYDNYTNFALQPYLDNCDINKSAYIKNEYTFDKKYEVVRITEEGKICEIPIAVYSSKVGIVNMSVNISYQNIPVVYRGCELLANYGGTQVWFPLNVTLTNTLTARCSAVGFAPARLGPVRAIDLALNEIVIADADGDGIPDVVDNCPLEYATYFGGCPAALRVIATNHTLIIEANRNKPKAVKLPLAGLKVEVYNLSEIREALKIAKSAYEDDDVDDDAFDSYHRGKISAKNYTWIRANFLPLYTCVTNESGECTIGVSVWDPHGDHKHGRYVVIGVTDAESARHLVRFANVKTNQTRVVRLMLLSVPEIAKTIAGKSSKVKASSELVIIEPDYLVWESTSEVYPQILESADAWDITVAVYPPSGWVSDAPFVDAMVNASVDTAMFTLSATSTDVGRIESKIVAKHVKTGKKVELRSKVDVEARGPLKEKIEVERKRWWRAIPFIGAMVDGIITDTRLAALVLFVILVIITIVALRVIPKKKRAR